VDIAILQLGLYRLFFEAGLAIGFTFILGVALGLAVMSYLKKREGDK
jgi:hypothetical protein